MKLVVVGLLTSGLALCQQAATRPPPPGCPAQGQPPRRIRISANFQPKLITAAAKPELPRLAKLARVHGKVIMAAVIDKEGKVASLHVLQGHPFLVPAALDAAKQYRYEPTLLLCTPISVEMTIEIEFKPEIDPVAEAPLK
jgi:TonB family protein